MSVGEVLVLYQYFFSLGNKLESERKGSGRGGGREREEGGRRRWKRKWGGGEERK